MLSVARGVQVHVLQGNEATMVSTFAFTTFAILSSRVDSKPNRNVYRQKVQNREREIIPFSDQIDQRVLPNEKKK